MFFTATLALVTLVALAPVVRAYPENYLEVYPTGGCYAPLGTNVMGGSNSFTERNVDIQFVPALVGGQYTPCVDYTLTITGDSNLQRTLMGADGGIFRTPAPSSCGTNSCGAAKGGVQSCYPCDFAGYRTNAAGKRTTGWAMCGNVASNFEVGWRAPTTGTVIMGATRAQQYGGGTFSTEKTITSDGGGPGGDVCPGETAYPTPSPIAGPPPATGTYDANLCTDTAVWGIFDTDSFPANVKACWRVVDATTFEIAIEAPTGNWVALGISEQQTGMQNIDAYVFMSSMNAVQNRFAASKSTPALEDVGTDTYRVVANLASSPTDASRQVVIRRPRAASGNRIDLAAEAPTFYTLVATGTNSGQTMSIHSVKSFSASASNLAATGAVGSVDVLFSTSSKRAHGAMMIFAWVFLCPTAVVDARVAKGVLGPVWFKLHRLFQTLAVLLTIVGFILIKSDVTVDITDVSADATQLHSKIGTAVFVLSIFQMLLGYFRNIIAGHTKNSDHEAFPHGPYRYVFNYAHWITGAACTILGFLNVYSGIWLNCPNDPAAGSPCADGIGWIKTPVKKVYGGGVYFAIIVYVLFAVLQLLVKFQMVSDDGRLDIIGRHAFALVAAVTFSCAVTMTTIVGDSDEM